MTDVSRTSRDTQAGRPRWLSLLWIVLPLAVLGLAVAWMVSSDPLASFRNGAPPVENLTFERTIIGNDGIRILVRAGGSEPMTIAQVQVDDAYWQFTQDPPGPIPRGATAWISLPYPWVLGEAHAINVVTSTGTTFGHDIAVAVPTPTRSSPSFAAQAVLGGFVGILPVAIGLMFYPALRGVGRNGMDFLLSMTVGLLAFLFVDTLEDAFELAGEAAALFQGSTMIVLAATASFLLLMAAGRRSGTPTGLALATFIALGIGLHNLGEGLAIGAAFVSGAAGLGTFLVLGFTLHNITEGIGIAAPILKQRPPLRTFAMLTLLAGGPAVVGLWIGSLAYAPQWSALALAIGAGAILQVIVEMVSLQLRQRPDGSRALLAPAAMAGLTAGVGFMYLTAMLVKI
ncbi:MAG: metal transporter [Mesorhizobium sp.]|uniref:ZIP family metal transporter n=3 Tax=Mesorhizobium TaxID=68287 RepID=UPI000FC9D2A7|nr:MULTISPECIES: ZIP family metal transporter [unclassified Mesorhizobium]TGV88313.1 metal transporter [Mesorhizobium sp. M00.F.Ca.ET.158.01.1.1]MCT2577773.1 ZIP family metal transporter [Mesorhizobium sp. P13.3]MDF3166711.1 ZIP family metal transporter [Mesorhizobium sp. P16.1]MDF3179285.1 ZIP family metal transporter [Mesorhizobium sp. P17.1]MDF3183177.1 ZIP family metal transporter [Mesorhizobium sp. ICCV3110.1]